MSNNRFTTLAVTLSVILLSTTVCSSPEGSRASLQKGETVIRLGKKDNRRLLRFYVGGMIAPLAQDPFEAGALREEGGVFILRLDSLSNIPPSLKKDLSFAAEDELIDWQEFEALILKNYYTYRALPETLESLIAVSGDWSTDSLWFSFGVNGVMSPLRREIHVPYSDLFTALTSYEENGDELRYPVGTTFVSEHLDGDERVEVSVMRKRGDGFWDFFAYDERGRLTSSLRRNPSNLDVPTKCIGCHFGSRLFEPERSFPVTPRPGPDGVRALYLSHALPGADLITRLDEHRKRSDLVLGLYGTFLLGKLRSLRKDNGLTPREKDLLSAFEL